MIKDDMAVKYVKKAYPRKGTKRYTKKKTSRIGRVSKKGGISIKLITRKV